MKFKSDKLIVPQDDPFANDCLSRKDHIESLTALLTNISTPSVLSINGSWGDGKTTFLEMLKVSLINDGCNVVSFNAWETDHVADPLLAFIGELNEQLGEFLGENATRRQTWDVAKSVSRVLIKRGIPILGKVAAEVMLEADDAIESAAGDLVSSTTDDLLQRYQFEKSAVTEFKTKLGELIRSGGDSVEKFYVLVDELDRCRPTYAIETLERIKHLFDIPGLVFVLAIDKVQLGHSIRAVYGHDFDSIGYLRRFIDHQIDLPQAERTNFISVLNEYYGFDSFLNSDDRRNSRELQGDAWQLREISQFLLNREQYSLRNIEQFFSKLNLIIRATGDREYLHVPLLLFLIVAEESKREVFRDYIDSESSPERAVEYLYSLAPNGGLDVGQDDPRSIIEGFLIAGKMARGRENLDQLLGEHKKIVGDESEGNNSAKSYSSNVIRVVESISGFRTVSLDHVLKKLELLNKFNFK